MVTQDRKPSTRLVRSPLLILGYLSGLEEFPGDTPEERAARPTEGDYISRMHRRVKAKYRELAPHYVWPRIHSFKSLVLMLEKLGLVERTGFEEISTEIIGLDKSTGQLRDVPRAGELRLDPALGFQRRSYFRLTPGSEDRVEWADPVGHIALIYPGVRPVPSPLPTRLPPTLDLGDPAPTPAAPPRPVRRRGAAPSQDVTQLEQQRQLLFRFAEDAPDFTTVEEFDALTEQAETFRFHVGQQFTRNPFPALSEAITLLRQCTTRLDEAIVGRRPAALIACVAAARLLGQAVSTPLRGTVEPVQAFLEEEPEDETEMEEITREITATNLSSKQLQDFWEELTEPILGWGRPNSVNARTRLERFQEGVVDLAAAQDVEEPFVDIGTVESALESYESTERSDFTSSEEFSEARADAWEEFLEAIREQDFDEEAL